MLYQKKRRKLNLMNDKEKTNEESTQNSDRMISNQKTSQLSRNKKSFTKLFTKRALDKEVSQKQPSLQKIHHRTIQSLDYLEHMESQITTNDQILKKQQLNSQQQIEKQKPNYHSNTNSTCSLQTHNVDQQFGASKKKFKLYCQVKKKKQNQKKSEYQKDTDRFGVSSTVSESCIKNSIFSKNSDRNCSNSTNKSQKNKSIKRKIDLTQKIQQIRSNEKLKQKQTSSLQQYAQSNQQYLNVQFNNKDTLTKISEQSSRRSKKSLQKKHSTVNIKRQSILPKLKTKKKECQQQSSIHIQLAQSIQLVKQTQSSVIRDTPSFIRVQNRILPDDSQIISESVKKLSEIRQQRNQDTISRSLKVTELNSIDHSTSKNTALHLSVNSVCRYTPYNCILQTTQLRQSNLRKEIESSLSQLEKTRQKINIEKFKQPQTIGEMGSDISNVEHNMTVLEKIEFHIELINTLSNFVYKSTQLEYLMEDWDELNFLIYKKFYIQRTRVLNFLKKYPIKNPFCIKRASIQTKDVLKTLRQNEPQIKIIKQSLERENLAIKKNLEVFYNQFSKEKHGEKINLFQYDNFSHWIYKQLWDEIQLFSYSQSHNQKELQDRICKSLQAGFLISQLNGNFVVPFEDAEIVSHHNRQNIYIEDNFKIFERYVLNKKK